MPEFQLNGTFRVGENICRVLRVTGDHPDAVSEAAAPATVFFPVLFEASDRICAAGGEVSSHPQCAAWSETFWSSSTTPARRCFWGASGVQLPFMFGGSGVCFGFPGAWELLGHAWKGPNWIAWRWRCGRTGRRTCLCSPPQQSPQADTHTQNGACRRAGAIWQASLCPYPRGIRGGVSSLRLAKGGGWHDKGDTPAIAQFPAFSKLLAPMKVSCRLAWKPWGLEKLVQCPWWTQFFHMF